MSNFASQLVENTKDLIWTINPERRLVYFNPMFRKIFIEELGIKLALNEELDLSKLFHRSAKKDWEECFERVLVGEKVELQECVFGTERLDNLYFKIHIYPVYEGEKVIELAFIAHDITEYVNIQQETNQILSQIRECFIEQDLEFACKQMCSVIQEFGNYHLVELWLPNMEQSRLMRIAYSAKSHAFDGLNRRNRAVFRFGEGYPGIVWEKNQQMFWENPSEDDQFHRKEQAQQAGIKMFKGIPLRYHDQIMGVLLIGVEKPRKNIHYIGGLFDRLESVIGSEIYRKRLEDDFERIYQAIPDMLCVVDMTGRFLRINPAGLEILGYNPEEIILKPITQFIHPEDGEYTFNTIRDNIEQRIHEFRINNRYISKEGKIVWFSWNCTYSIQEGVVYAAAKDVTFERQLAELNRQAYDMAKIGSWEINLEDNTVFWSEVTHQIHKTDPSTFHPNLENAIAYYREDCRPIITSCVQKCIDQQGTFDQELVILTTLGEEKWVRCIGTSEHVNGKCVKIYGSIQDIHESKSLAHEIKEILESISDAFYAVDENWKFTYFNEKAERLLEKKESEVIGKVLWDVLPFVRDTELWTNYHKVKETNQSMSFEFFYTVDQNWYELNVYPSKGGLSVYFKNINERKLIATALQNALDEKNRILDSIGDGFFALDKEWNITYWNRTAEKMIGPTKEEVMGKYFWDFFPAARGTSVYQNYFLVDNITEAFTTEEYYDPLDLWLDVSFYPTAEGYSVYFKDASARRKAEEEIKLANERFLKATEATQDAIWDWDIVTDTIYRSKNIVNFYGADAQSEISSTQYWFHRFHQDDVKKLRQTLSDALNDPTKNRWEMEYRIFTDDESMRYVMDRGVIIRDEQGKPIRMVGAMSDLTRQKMLERELIHLNNSLNRYAKELERSNEELEQFAFITSHDLQEPLRMITSFMDQLQRRYSDQLDERALQYIYYATDGAKRMKQIILDLLEYSRAGRLGDQLESVNLQELMDDFKLLRRKIIAEKRAVLEIGPMPVVKSNKAALTQVFHSLIDNAIKYTQPGVPPKIEVKAVEKDVEWEISIKDAGIGIKPEFFNKIFVIFQRLHNRNEYSGTGIGLSIAKRHVESLGGRIWVESVPKEGSTFYFTIPKT